MNEKNTRSANFYAEQNGVITNFAIITNVVIKRVHCISLAKVEANGNNVCIPILVTTLPEWLSGTEPLPHTPGAVRPSSLCL